MASPPGGGRSPAWCYIPPLVRAALAWLFVICLTQVDGSTFYVLVRGVGAVEYSDAIVVGSHALDFGVLAVVTALFGLSVLAVVAVVGNVRWVVGGFDGSTPFSDPSWSFSFVGLQIIALLDPILPEITLVMLFGWVAWLLLPLVSRSAKAWMSAGCPGEGSAGFGVAVSRRASFVMLGAAVLISVFVGAYPYLHAVNPNSLIVGVDPRYCYSRILDGLPGLGYPCGGHDRVLLHALRSLPAPLGVFRYSAAPPSRHSKSHFPCWPSSSPCRRMPSSTKGPGAVWLPGSGPSSPRARSRWSWDQLEIPRRLVRAG